MPEQPEAPASGQPETTVTEGIVTVAAAPIQNETDSSDGDSNYYSDADSDLTSLSSSIKNHVFENGRRYHAFREGKYVLPNDEAEKDRLDLLHHLFQLVFKGALQLSPLKDPQKILDMGTGTGIWALDMADQYPSATVIGNDLSAIQPGFVAPNVQFIIEDIEEEWSYPENHFDFVHGRTLLGSIKDWKELFANAYKHIKPGGWVEIQEGIFSAHSDDGTLKPDSHIVKYFELLKEATASNGRAFDLEDKLGPWMKDAGFINVKIEIFKIPWGPWPKDPHLKEIGKFQYHNAMEGIDSYALALLTRGLGWKAEEANIFLAQVRSDIRNKNIHTYNNLYVFYGQKPLAE